MKNIKGLFVLVMALGMLMNVGTGQVLQERACGAGTDLCAWSSVLPL